MDLKEPNEESKKFLADLKQMDEECKKFTKEFLKTVSRPGLYYRLDENKNPVECDMMEAFSVYEENKTKNRMKRTEFKKYDCFVSTVFLPINHNYDFESEKRPIVFETMIFWESNEKLDGYERRYCTYKDALIGHRRAVRKVIKAIRESKNGVN
jgi:hypothetical protein